MFGHLNRLVEVVFFVFLSVLITGECFGNGSSAIFDRFPNKYFIKTGTYCGAGVDQALKTGKFEVIYSIELSDHFYPKDARKLSPSELR